jgi:isoleucyl-tRNA synthetase
MRAYCRTVPFGPVDPQVDLVALEEQMLARWRELDLFDQAKNLRKGARPWVFYEGPPTANGSPGLHHVWARVFKDLYPRFQTMRGRDVPRKGGWDCHGLPVELEVEKELGFTHKNDIEAYGIAKFNDRCRDSVQRYVEDFAAVTQRAAVWIDTRDAYWTLSNDYIESVWWLMRQLWDKGLLDEGHSVVPYCPRCGTALSSHEVALGYRDVTDPSVYVRFPLEQSEPDSTEQSEQDSRFDRADLLVWTTTPWTLISNVAAAVGPEITYVRVRDTEGGRDLIMAEALAAEDAEVVARFTGRDLVGRGYVRPFDYLPVDDKVTRVVAAGFVSTEDGSGIVHLAPAFGADDMQTARVEGLPVLNPVGPDGTFDASVPPYRGRFVKDADEDIIADLDRRGLLVRRLPYAHSYPHCWRCGTPLIYWAQTAWFVRTTARKADLLAQNEIINWHPEHIRHGRFGDWLENNVDWAVSRDRYWGTPLPIWRCDEGHDTCIGSVAELGERSGRDLGALDLHRPFVDDVTFPCPHPGCSARAKRLEAVLDAWFDSGSMPSAQHHYPFADRRAFEDAFPADFICEAIDQTRGWFYSLLAVNTLVFGETPYRNVVCLGHIVDAEGQKMSKSRGNVIDPWHIFNTFGSDALRWYFFSSGSPWTSRRVSEEGIREAARKTLLTLWNVFSFFASYADLDGWAPTDEPLRPNHALDRWVLDQLDDTVAAVTAALDDFDALAAATSLATFVDDLSNWYVRRSRPRFWKSSDPVAHATLHRCLVVTSQLLAPFCPFLADALYTPLTGETSVHLSDWPEPARDVDRALAGEMEVARRLVGLGRAARTEARARVRQPLRRALLLHPGGRLSDEVRREVADELNVKALEDVESLAGLMSWTVVPNFKALGPRLGPKVNEVKLALAAADGAELKQALDEQGFIEIARERLGPDDVEVRAREHEDFALAQEGAWAVAIDLDLDDALRLEGTARELVRALNDLRRAAGLALSDRIAVRLDVTSAPRVAAAVDAHRAWIGGEVLAVSLEAEQAGGGGDDTRTPGARHHVEVDDEPVVVELRVAGA